jgi:hypothetical protein
LSKDGHFAHTPNGYSFSLDWLIASWPTCGTILGIYNNNAAAANSEVDSSILTFPEHICSRPVAGGACFSIASARLQSTVEPPQHSPPVVWSNAKLSIPHHEINFAGVGTVCKL